MYILVGKSKPEDIVDMKDGWVHGGKEKDVTDVKFDSSHQVVSSEEDGICDVLAHNLQTHYVCVCASPSKLTLGHVTYNYSYLP